MWVVANIGMRLMVGGFLFAIFALCADRFFAPDMSRFEERSHVVLDAEGGLLRAFTADDGIWRLPVEVAHVDPNFVDALIAYEDQRFYSHPGVDLLAIGRAIVQWARAGRIVSGASTLTMQTARLLEPRRRTIWAKSVEMVRALQLEWRYSKDEILSIYLTLAPYGGNIEGVRAASLAYFGKEPAELSPAQTALLIALPQSPERLRPDRYPDAALSARDRVLGVIAERGHWGPDIAAEARADVAPDRREPLPFVAPRLSRHLRGEGSTVQTFIQPHLQSQVERLVREVDQELEDEASVAVLVVENGTSRVVAYAGGSDFWGPQGQVDVVRSFRSPGSTLKPFIYALGFDDLPLHPETRIDDRAMTFGGYRPQNFDRGFAGEVNVRIALQQSLNIPAVAVLDRVGPMRLASRLQQAGLRLRYGEVGVAPSLPLALGGVGIRLEDLAMLYAAVASGGEACPLRYQTAHTRGRCERVMSQRAAWYLTEILQGSPRPDGRGFSQGGLATNAIAFKTGTSYGYRDAWAIGYTPQHTVGIWVGRPDGSPRPGSFGRNTAAPLLFDVFDHLPVEMDSSAVPDGVLQVRSADDLPLPMRVFLPVQQGPSSVDTMRPLRIAYPPEGAVVRMRGDQPTPIVLRSAGGQGAIRWMINGEVLEAGDRFEPTVWTADAAGFARLTAIDSTGQAAHALVRVVE